MIAIRAENSRDTERIRAVNVAAFGQTTEADIVERLRLACAGFLSLVAEDDAEGADDGAIVGHLLFTPAALGSAPSLILGMGLAPMAVLPGRQRQGIGSALVRRGLALLRASGCPFVVVLGHPEFYPRFGFEPASKHGLRSQWDGVPDAAFMALILDRAAMAGVTGVASYRSEFDHAI